MTETRPAYKIIGNGSQDPRRAVHVQKRAEKFFYNQILQDLKDQFLDFMNDGFSAQLVNERTRRLVDDIIGTVGNVRLDRLNSVRFFIEHDDVFRSITEILRELPQKERIDSLLGNDDATRKYSIVLTLRPPGAERMSERQPHSDPVATSIIMDVLMRWLTYARERQKALGDILAGLERVEASDLEQYSCLPDTIGDVCRNMATYAELQQIIENTMKKTLSAKDCKPAPKRWFWEKVIVQGIELINDFCHDAKCPSDCRKIHDQAIEKTAAILILLYPDHFRGSADNVAGQIKARYFEVRYPANEEDRFIRNLFSRYVDDSMKTIDDSSQP